MGLALVNGGSLHDLIIRYLNTGIQSDAPCSAMNLQFSQCAMGFDTENTTLYAGNILMSQVGVGFGGWDFQATAEHLTCDQATYLSEDYTYGTYGSDGYDNLSSVSLVNSVLTGGWVSMNAMSPFGEVSVNSNIVASSGSSDLYEPAVAGSYYLASDSPYRNQGTTNIHPGTLALLQTMTTYAQQDGGYPDNDGMPDLGYHYPSVDPNSLLNGVPAWWIWQYFGSYAYNGTDLDCNTNTLLYDYTNNVAPAVFTFTGIAVTNNYMKTANAPAQLDVAGSPYYIAIAVDDTNYLNDAVWNTYTSPNITIPLGTVQGWHDVRIGLRGHNDPVSAAVWLNPSKRLKLDTVPPQLAVTSPALTGAAATVNIPVIQLMGSSPEALGGISYDLSNAAGTFTNQDVLILDQNYDATTWEFTTTTFEAFDVPLTNGVNVITLHAADVAGNVMTTNFSFTLDYSGKTNPPVVQITWPQNGTEVSGTNFTLDGFVDDPTATVSATVTGTNGVASAAEGFVETSGRFWLENLPLNTGTNVLTVTVADVIGNTTTTNIAVVQSPVTMTMNDVANPAQLWNPTVNLTGTISATNYAVWVNGVKGHNNGNGTWYANNVPTTPGGVASFTVTAYSPDETQPDNSHGN